MTEPSHNVTPLFTVANQILVNFFDTEQTKNYIAHEVEDVKTGDKYIITMQKVDGETPFHQLAKANDEIQRLKHALAQVADLAGRDAQPFGIKRADVVERAKEALREQCSAGMGPVGDTVFE